MSTTSTPANTPIDAPAKAFELEPVPGTRRSGYEFLVLEPPGRTLKKYVFIQDDPFYLPKVLDKYLREFGDSTAGINIQPDSRNLLWRPDSVHLGVRAIGTPASGTARGGRWYDSGLQTV